jgi:hypothetical protein
MRSLAGQGRGGYYDLPGPNARLERMKQAAAARPGWSALITRQAHCRHRDGALIWQIQGKTSSSARTSKDAYLAAPDPGGSYLP